MNNKKNFYDLSLLHERIKKLRAEQNEDKITLEALSEMIFKKTREYISPNTLGKYERKGEPEKMRIGNLIAIANFYDVSIDYLLGETNSIKKDELYKKASKKFSLSDNAMKQLITLTNNKSFSFNYFKLRLINYIIENDTFLLELSMSLLDFYKATDNKSVTKAETVKDYNASRYALNSLFEKFIDDSYENLYKANQPKKKYLIDMPKDKKTKKENR